ncbi:hypothetical protein KCP78_02170 [Salmonella enterica subsp. enterica]|nr:hypothetical protein KCP78_02170 [Salmonella enterica subsp. enterica]
MRQGNGRRPCGILRADDTMIIATPYATFRHRTGIDIANARGGAPRHGRHYAPDRSGKNLQLSGRYDESGFAWCVHRNATPSPAADIWRLRADKSDSTSAYPARAIYRPDKRSAVSHRP